MAKQRKQKQKDGNRAPVPTESNDRCCATVREQKLCVAVDLEQERVYGYAELTVVTPKNGVIGLHARGLHIDQVLVDGVSSSFELQQKPSRKQQKAHNGDHVLNTADEMADTCYSKYKAALEEEMIPELLIHPGEASTPLDPIQDPPSFLDAVVEAAKENAADQPPASVDPKPEQCNVVRVEYWVEKPHAGAYFKDKVFHTNCQLRRTRCWFPCVDSATERCSFSLEITVPSEYVAISNGKLLYQVYSKEGPHLKTYAYSMSIPVTADYISLVVAPLVVLPDLSNMMITHMCMAGDASRLQCTVNFFHSLFSTYEEYLGAPFPFGCYKQVFIDSESTISSVSVGASMVTLSSNLLVDERIIDQAFVTQVKLAHALAQQWFGVFITPETPADAWLLEGLAGFLCDQFVKRYMGNNEARYRRFKANEAVCMVDLEGAPVLSSMSSTELYGTEKLGVLGQIRAWKATAVVQMLEKQMGPEPLKKILQRIILRAQDPVRHLRTLSTKEFRHFANKLGNLERPFLKEFFPRWVESSGCPRLKMGFVYSKRRNTIELAVHRESTAVLESSTSDNVTESKPVPADPGWPGMMSIRVHELDGMYDHPSLPMAGDTYQLLDIQCHSKLAGRRVTKPKKGSKPEATEDNTDTGAADVRLSLESPLLWLRADPQMEYIAEIRLNQPEQMWINQLEKDRDVVGQLQAITAMAALPRPSFAIATALNNSLTDSKVFYRVRVEAASALATTATEANSWMGLSHLMKFYNSCRCDPDIGLPKSNDFHDLAEYFVLEAIPGAIAAVRGSDGKSPVEATDFVLRILKHNDNSGNLYSDVYWLACVIEAVGEFEFGQQNMQTLSKFLKQIDRFLQYDRLMPSYNSVLTISCIRTLTRLAVKFSQIMPLQRLELLLTPLGDARSTVQQVRITALQSLLEIKARSDGLDAAVKLALQLVGTDPSLNVQAKLMEHMIIMSELNGQSITCLSSQTLQALLEKLDSVVSFSNVVLRHHFFSLLQIVAGRSASLYRREEVPVLPTSIPAEQQNTALAKAPPKEAKATKSVPPLKVKVQQPHTEPIRIHVVPVRPIGTPKEEHPVATASSGGKDPKGALRVGKVKLRLKPASLDSSGASPLERSVGSLEKARVATSQSPASVQVSAKAEPVAEESCHSHGRIQKGVDGQKAKQEIATPATVEEGEIESADDNVIIKEEAATPEEQSHSVAEMRAGFGADSGKDNIRETGAGTSDASDTKPVGVFSADTITQEPNVKQKSDKKHKKDKKRHRDKHEDAGSQDKKRAKENDIEYQERKRKRREEKDQKKREKEGRKSEKMDVNKTKPIKDQESPAVPEVSKSVDSGQKIRLKIKKILTIPTQQ